MISRGVSHEAINSLVKLHVRAVVPHGKTMFLKDRIGFVPGVIL